MSINVIDGVGFHKLLALQIYRFSGILNVEKLSIRITRKYYMEKTIIVMTVVSIIRLFYTKDMENISIEQKHL